MNALPQEEVEEITPEQYIRSLHALRVQKAGLILEKTRRQVEFDQQCADLFKDMDEVNREIATHEAIIKDAALIAFGLSGDKAAIGGVQVKEINQPPIYDNDRAMAWAQKDAPMFILTTFDNKGFDGYLKTAATVPDFVTIPDPKPRADIATDLSAIVGKEE
jgi:PIN domain nuclease of toxin-antitoxin system